MTKEEFKKYYLPISLMPTQEHIEVRWSIVKDYAEEYDGDILDLIKIYYNLKVDNDFKNSFVENFTSSDIKFDSDNQREISLLAGVVLLILLDDKNYKREIVLASMSIHAFATSELINDYISIIVENYNEMAINQREAVYINKDTHGYSVYHDIESTLSGESLINEINSRFINYYNRQLDMEKAITVFKEDSNILSWLFGGCSDYLEKKLTKSVLREKVALILSREFSGLIATSYGPYQAQTYIKYMLNKCKSNTTKYTLQEMLEQLKEEDLHYLIKGYEDKELETPILKSIQMLIEHPSYWLNVIEEDRYNIVDNKHTVVEWAMQFYYEQILIKW